MDMYGKKETSKTNDINDKGRNDIPNSIRNRTGPSPNKILYCRAMTAITEDMALGGFTPQAA
jgi:hypothetical protein